MNFGGQPIIPSKIVLNSKSNSREGADQIAQNSASCYRFIRLAAVQEVGVLAPEICCLQIRMEGLRGLLAEEQRDTLGPYKP